MLKRVSYGRKVHAKAIYLFYCISVINRESNPTDVKETSGKLVLYHFIFFLMSRTFVDR